MQDLQVLQEVLEVSGQVAVVPRTVNKDTRYITKDSPSCSKVVNTVAPQIGYSSGYQVVVLAVAAE